MSIPPQTNKDKEFASGMCLPSILIGLWTSSLGLMVEFEIPNYCATCPPNQVQLMTEEERDNVIVRWIKP